jgi:FkbM family methyltransferase
MRSLLRALVRRLGWSLHRWPANRFDAMDDTLTMLRDWGYAPRVVVDVGANVGAWTDMASLVFSDARFHLIEPQPSCAGMLRRFAPPRFVVHQVVATAPGADMVRMVGHGTGAGVAGADDQDSATITARAVTLDALLSNEIAPSDRALLKLDIEGHEIEALRGASELLARVEVVVCEVQFFDIGRHGRPVFADVVRFMRQQSFELHDVAALASRPRDRRLRMGDVVFVRTGTPLAADVRWA